MKQTGLCLGWLIIGLVMMSCMPWPDSRAEELKVAYEKYLTVTQEAYLAGDTSELPKVTTGEELEYITKSVNNRSPFFLTLTDTEIQEFYVEEYQNNQATVKGVLHFRNYTYEISTGRKEFMSETWSRIIIEMVKEKGVWKVAGGELKEYM